MSEINIDNYLSTDLSAFEEQYLSTESYLPESISAMFKDRYFDLVDIQLDKKQEVHNKKFNVSIVQMPSNCLDKVS